jgi:hypothetical protein
MATALQYIWSYADSLKSTIVSKFQNIFFSDDLTIQVRNDQSSYSKLIEHRWSQNNGIARIEGDKFGVISPVVYLRAKEDPNQQAALLKHLSSSMDGINRSPYALLNYVYRSNQLITLENGPHRQIRKSLKEIIQPQKLMAELQGASLTPGGLSMLLRDKEVSQLVIVNYFAKQLLGLRLSTSLVSELSTVGSVFGDSFSKRIPSWTYYFSSKLNQRRQKFDEVVLDFLTDDAVQQKLQHLLENKVDTLLTRAIKKFLNKFNYDSLEGLDTQEWIFLSQEPAVRDALLTLFPLFNVANILHDIVSYIEEESTLTEKLMLRVMSVEGEGSKHEALLSALINWGIQRYSRFVAIARHVTKDLYLPETDSLSMKARKISGNTLVITQLQSQAERKKRFESFLSLPVSITFSPSVMTSIKEDQSFPYVVVSPNTNLNNQMFVVRVYDKIDNHIVTIGKLNLTRQELIKLKSATPQDEIARGQINLLSLPPNLLKVLLGGEKNLLAFISKHIHISPQLPKLAQNSFGGGVRFCLGFNLATKALLHDVLAIYMLGYKPNLNNSTDEEIKENEQQAMPQVQGGMASPPQ